MNAKIEMTIIHETKKPGTKTVWIEKDRNTEIIPEDNYKNCVDAVSFFRGLGGHEHVEKAYTYIGNVPVKITSTSPDGKIRTIRMFKFSKA